MPSVWGGTGHDRTGREGKNEQTPRPPLRAAAMAAAPPRGGAPGAGPPGLSRPAGPYAVRLTSRRTEAARTREKEGAASPRSPPPFCLCAQGGHGARSLSAPVVSGEGGLSSFSFHLRFFSSFLSVPRSGEAAGKRDGDAGRGGVGMGVGELLALSPRRGAHQALPREMLRGKEDSRHRGCVGVSAEVRGAGAGGAGLTRRQRGRPWLPRGSGSANAGSGCLGCALRHPRCRTLPIPRERAFDLLRLPSFLRRGI